MESRAPSFARAREGEPHATTRQPRFRLLGEDSRTRIAATFADRAAAEGAATKLNRDPALHGEVAVVRPDDPLVARKLEPERRGIGRTLTRSHAIPGAAGALIGAGVAVYLLASWPAMQAAPWLTALVAVVFGASGGILIAGALTLRPDHAHVIRRVRDALVRRHWAVVVRPIDAARTRAALATLRAAGAHPVRSF